MPPTPFSSSTPSHVLEALARSEPGNQYVANMAPLPQLMPFSGPYACATYRVVDLAPNIAKDYLALRRELQRLGLMDASCRLIPFRGRVFVTSDGIICQSAGERLLHQPTLVTTEAMKTAFRAGYESPMYTVNPYAAKIGRFSTWEEEDLYHSWNRGYDNAQRAREAKVREPKAPPSTPLAPPTGGSETVLHSDGPVPG